MTRTALLLALATCSPALAAPPPVSALAYRPDGKLLAAGTRGVVYLIDPVTGDAVANLPDQIGRVTAVAFARSGTLAVASGEPSRSGVIRLYDTERKLLAEFVAHKDAIYALAFSPDGRTLATAGYDKLIKLWSIPPSAKPEPRLTLTDHSDAVYALDFHPSGKLLASGSADRAVKVWDVKTGKRLYTLGDPTDWVYAVAWCPDGKTLAAGGADKSIRVWEADESGGRLVRSAFAHTRTIARLAFTGDGRTLVSAGEDRVVKLWDPEKLTEKKVIPAQPDDILALAVRSDGKQFAVGRFDGVLQFLDPATGKPTATPIPVKPKPPTIASITPDSAPRGQVVRVRLEGNRLDAVTGARSTPAGVNVSVVVRSRSHLEADVSIPADLPPGAVQLVLTSEGGDSNSVRLWADRFPAVGEQGPTDSASGAMPVKLPATVVGTLDRAGDADFFRFNATAGQQVGVQVTTAADRGKFDPVIVLTDATGQVLTEGANGLLGYTCPTAGGYCVGIRDRDYRGGAALTYRLHVGPVPVVTSVFPLGVARGRETSVRVSGVNLEERRIKVAPPADAAIGTKLTLPIQRAGGDPAGRAEVTVGEFPAVAVRSGRAELPAVPATADGILRTDGEAHLVRFPARKGQQLVVEVHAARLGSPVDSFIEVLDAAGKPVPRAVLRCTAKTFVTFRDHDSSKPGIRLEYWNELAMDDLLYVGGDLMKIKALPRNPDDDCQFYQVDGKRVGFLDTTPTYHAQGTPMYRVEVHPPGSTFPPNGMPLFQLAYRNDDGGPAPGNDSSLTFDPPADGEYQVRITDANRAAGPTYAYRLTVRPPRPDFTIRFTPTAPKVWKGGAVPVTITATRIDGFDGPIDVKFDGLPAPFHAPATRIEAGQLTAAVALSAGNGPVPDKIPPLKLEARAAIDGKEVVREAVGSPPAVVEPGDLVTTTNLAELVIQPGTEAKLRVKIERRNGHKGRVPLDVRGLPHGVRVLHVGLNGILILPNQTEREVVIYAEPWVKPMETPFVVLSRSERKGTEHAAPSVTLKVQK
jgi:hypothetical protein